MKRGFATKREAEEWAREFLSKKSPDFNMKFKNFVDLYFEDMETRLRASTVTRKHYLMDLKILPYFGENPINEISVSDIRTWQNIMLKGDYSQTYLRAMNNEIKAKEHRRGIYSGMMLEDSLKEHCLSIQHQAEERMDVIVEQMARAQGIDERLKASDQMQWVRMMNNIRVCAEESVLKELIYS